MTWTRREILRTGIVGAGSLLAPSLLSSCSLLGAEKSPKPLKVLVLGGTRFLGPAIVDAALARGHEVTLFNRGRSNPHMYPDLEKLRGDRDGDLKSLEGRQWDGVVDTSGYIPRLVGDSAKLLAPNVQQYLFISSVSVYERFGYEDVDELATTGSIGKLSLEKVTGKSYGPLKALCEEAAEKALPGRVTNIRPGLIVGKGDSSDRFTYWPVRVDRGGEMLAPGTPAETVQVIDVRDLGEWIVECLEARVVGVFNADGKPLPMGELLDTCKQVTGKDTKLTWVSEKFLSESRARVPIWIPRKGAASINVSVSRALQKGLRLRPISETVRSTLDFHKTRPEDHKWRAGLTPEKEKDLLAAWHKAQVSTGG